MTTPHRIGIVSALRQEQSGLVEAMTHVNVEQRGMRDYVCGELWGQPVVCVLARLGKVAAAATVATLIERFDVTHVVFTGVAGGAGFGLKPGDIVVAESLVQHDMDVRPLFPRFEVPLLGKTAIEADLNLSDRLAAAAQGFIESDLRQLISPEEREAFRLHSPLLRRGLIASGDEFISSALRVQQLREALPHVLAVEMEGAAVAQVCLEFGVPFAVIRTISDCADDTASVDFSRFIECVAPQYARGTIERFLKSW